MKIKLLSGLIAAVLLSPGLSRAQDEWSGPLHGRTIRQMRLDAAELAAPSRPEKAPATIMFYLDNQNGDYVDSYIYRQLEAIKELSRKNRTIRWVTIIGQSVGQADGQRSFELKDQNLYVNEWINGSAVPLGDFMSENKGLKPAFSDPGALVYFVKKGLSLGSGRNILVMADHGVGSYGLMTTSLKENGRDLNGVMNNKAAASAIAGAMRETNSRIDLVILDACLMSGIEAMTDYRQAGLEMPVIASENTTTPTSGSLNYRKTIGAVADAIETSRPFDALLYGAMIVNLSKNNNAINLSLVNLERLTDDLLGEMRGLFSGLAQDLKEPKKNKAYRKAFLAKIVAEKTISVGAAEVDLRTYLEMLQGIKSLSGNVRMSALELEKAVFPETVSEDRSRLVIVSENDQPAYTSEKGLSIAHPLISDERAPGPRESKYFADACAHSESLLFSSLTGWTEVLKAYAGVETCGSPY